MVQVAAKRVGFRSGWFTAYAILGDDIVIANHLVAEAYKALCQHLGVTIGLSKSLVSDDTFEFAKRLISKKGDMSPIGPKGIFRSLKDSRYLPAALADAMSKGIMYPNLEAKMLEMGDRFERIFHMSPVSHFRLLAALAGPTSVLGGEIIGSGKP